MYIYIYIYIYISIYTYISIYRYIYLLVNSTRHTVAAARECTLPCSERSIERSRIRMPICEPFQRQQHIYIHISIDILYMNI